MVTTFHKGLGLCCTQPFFTSNISSKSEIKIGKYEVCRKNFANFFYRWLALWLHDKILFVKSYLQPTIFLKLFFAIFSCCTKINNQAQEDLAKYGYKTNREIENLRIILLVDKLLKPISYIWQKKKARNLPKSYKNLGNFIAFFLEMWQFFWKFSKEFIWPCCFGLVFLNKMANFRH